MRVSTADDEQARQRGQAATRERRPTGRRPNGYLHDEPGQPVDLEPRHCRCSEPAPVAEVDRLTTTLTITCLTCGKPRAMLDRLDLVALAAVRRTSR